MLGCNGGSEEALPQAYIGPASVNLRSQLNQKNSTVTVLKHGQQVGVIDVRRRFIKVRTSNGAEGWVDSLDLLSPDEMQRVQRERAQALKLPSEGTATAYETLNIHLDPSRQSPAFAQIPEGGPVSVLARRVAPKVTEPARSSFAFERPKPISRKARRDKAAKGNARQPPMPPPPKPPTDRKDLWGFSDEVEGGEPPVSSQTKTGKQTAPSKPEKPSKPILEDWTLVRTKSNQTGWVLSRNLMMSIPDEVAQYAGGRHITSYFGLGAINDEKDGQKHNWLWTTASEHQTFDFDSWRVFLWNRRRHRYETSYRQRDLEGYFPVEVDPSDPAYLGRSFKLITKDDDGRFRRRSYLFDGTRVHLTATEDYRPGEASNPGAHELDANASSANARQSSWLQREWMLLKQRFAGSR
ncbi:MAG: SH3 domain-containing protein [Acidobacteriota bacterium]|nr:SH3 domain-containing protein [Acidobacteriota bacterium]